MKPKTFTIISLGCAKNTVDSDTMAQLLHREEYTLVENPQEAEVIIVNTCGFISSAREESYQILSEMKEQKEEGQILIAAGCLAQRSGEEIVRQIPQVDGVLGTRRWMDIGDVVRSLREGKHPQPLYHLPDVDTVGRDRRATVGAHLQGGSAYLKIADGCRRPCAFCAIPLIKGTAVSRPLDDILQDAVLLGENGVREINLIAQDTTDYGHDLGLKDGLAHLLEEMTGAVPEVDWIRILYAYPGYVTDRLIEVMATHKSVIPYLDMPLQHAHPQVLRRMQRPANVDWVHKTVAKLRKAMPGLALRTTFIVGYPGETEEEFQALLDFVEEMRFDRVGAFAFSFEADVPAEPLGDPIPQEIKVERMERLMLKQQDISLAKNQSLVGKTLDVLVEGQGLIEGTSETISLGRSYRDAPEIDGMVIVENELPIGEIVSVEINGATVYDLMGVAK
ncbi:MAG: Ribosomal protein S12 methylthiotransferase RimO [Chloroflexi bacterium]|nr:Ribosomal protein S12 methylthiotransferase RimO [Chloroflexota bacterium]